MKTLVKLLIISMFIVSIGCEKDDNNNEVVAGTVTDIDGNVYKTVKIGKQTWMAENLRVTKYNNGTPVPKMKMDTMVDNKVDYYKVDSSANKYFGNFYNYAVVIGNNNVCPTGWHVPELTEWEELIDYAGGEAVAGKVLKSKGNDFWNYDTQKSVGTDSLQFNVMGNGNIGSLGIMPDGLIHYGIYMTKERSFLMVKTVDYSLNKVYNVIFYNNKSSITFNKINLNYYWVSPIRCIKD